MAIAGFDDITTLLDVGPPLSSLRLSLADIGAKAMTMVSVPVDDHARRSRVKGTVVLRASTPPRT